MKPVLLIYRECGCGEWIATRPGAPAPTCGSCEKPLLPLGGNPPFKPTEQEFADWAANRRERGRAFVAFPEGEVDAVRQVEATHIVIRGMD